MATTDIKTIIDGLKQVNEEKSITFTLPISKHEVTVQPLNAKHTTMIDSSLIAGRDGSFALKFSQLVYDIFRDILTLPSGVTFKDFGVFDTQYIVLKMRESINPELDLNRDNTDKPKIVNIKENIKKAEKITDIVSEKEISYETIKVRVGLPSFSKNLRYDKIIESGAKQEKIDPEALATDAFIYTLLRFIISVTVVVDKEEHEMEFVELSPAQQRTVLDSVPNEMYRQLYDVIEELSSPIIEVLKTDYPEHDIPMDQTIFIDTTD